MLSHNSSKIIVYSLYSLLLSGLICIALFKVLDDRSSFTFKEKGMNYMQKHDYTKAEECFIKYLNEGHYDEESEYLISVINKYYEALELYNSNRLLEASDVINSLDGRALNYAIKDDLYELMDEVILAKSK